MKQKRSTSESARRLTVLRKKLNQKIHEYEHALESVKQEKEQFQSLVQQEEDVLHAQSILQQIAQQVQNKAHKQIARVVSKCLSAVFEEPYQLRIEFDRKRGRTEARFVYYRDGHKLNPRLTSGAAREVTALALRLASLVLTLPPARKLLVLDEPFLALSCTNVKRVGVLLNTLAKEMQVQIILITHNESLQVGKVVRIGEGK